MYILKLGRFSTHSKRFLLVVLTIWDRDNMRRVEILKQKSMCFCVREQHLKLTDSISA